MKKVIPFLLYTFLSLYTFTSAAQTHKNGSSRDHLIDSLKNVLNNIVSQAESQPTIKGQSLGLDIDTLRAKTLNKLAWELRNINTDTAIALSNEAFNLARNYIYYTSSSETTQKKVRNDIYQLIGKCYVQLGAFYKIRDEYNLALDYNFKALALFKEMEKDTALNSKSRILERQSVILGNIGAIYMEQGNYPKSLESHFEALKASELLGNKALIATKYINIGNVYHFKKDHQKSLDYHFKALKLSEEIGAKSKIALCLSNIGITYRHLHEYDKAIQNHLKALEIDKELDNQEDIARHYINMAAIYYDKRDFEKLLEYDYKALEAYKKLKSKSGIATSLGNIGSAQILLKRYKEAENNLQQALLISTEIKALHLMKEHEQFLFDLYQKSNQPAKALEHYLKYSTLKDSIFNEENTKKAVRSEMNFEFEKQQAIAKAEQEKQNAIALKEKQRQKLILIFVSCFLLLIAVFAGFMYNRWRVTQRQKAIIEKQKEKIVDSINYAQFIQESILIDETEIQKHIPGSFIFLQPKDIVSGDFYWFSKIVGSRKSEAGSQESGVQSSEFGVKVNESINSGLRTSDFQPKNNSELPANTKNYELRTTNSELLIIAAADCTGHGVPGAFMSMIGNTLLNQIVNEKRITRPSEILYHLNLGIYEALHQKKGQKMSRDGMDIALCCIDFKNKELQYAGAQNPLYLLKNNELSIVNSTKESIGGGLTFRPKNPLETKFTNHVIPIEPGMGIYIFSDGFKDQFGADNKQKFGSQQFKALILKSHLLEPSGQKELFATTLHNWQGNTPQTDDILVIGIKF